MSLSFNFGRFPLGQPARRRDDDDDCFRILLLGDFSGRGLRGEHRSREALKAAKLRLLDVDTLDAVVASFATTLSLPLGPAGGHLSLALKGLDDLHPDALYDQLPLFDELASLRQRLANPATSAAAAAEVRQWPAAAALRAGAPAPAADTLPAGAELADFARLLGHAPGAAAAAPPPSPIDALIRQAIAPYLVEAGAPDAKALIGIVDQALSATMRALLQQPDFQAIEVAWRTLDFAARRIETDETLKLLVLDLSAEEFAADLSAGDQLEDSALYQLLVAQPALNGKPLSALVGQYGFELSASHAELLGRIGAIAARAGAPFIGAIGRGAVGIEEDALEPRVAAAWAALRALPAARHLMLTTPRCLLRAPYGRRGESTERFAFEELAAPARSAPPLPFAPAPLLAAVLLAQHVRENGPDEAPGALLNVEDMACYHEVDADGDLVAVRCTELPLTERLAAQVHALGFTPVLSHKGRPEARLGGFASIAGGVLAGRWSGA
ncbi:type VI secretion system contractile sheath domain-containing protein [Aquabacterium sp.]|uniref:type VI secretion system contractile sheath domain-containing protein n=1 Tax=Aquabacterium sp. TaxID=1872578 RepID=UPI00378495B7